MKVNILTLFPEMFRAVTDESILGKASEKGIMEFNIVNIRDYSTDKHKKADETPFGGGAGMVMFCQPVFDALREMDPTGPVLYMSPRGKVLDQQAVEAFAKSEEITILCGHYEGVDQRILDYWNMQEVSIGDYILTGGELPAMVLIDAVSRFIPGVLGNEVSASDESIYSGLLEYDQYTKPREYEGMEVPEALTGGNHKEIRLWQLENSLRITAENRPDIFRNWIEKAGGIRKIPEHPDLEGLTKREKQHMTEIVREICEEKAKKHSK